IFDEGDERADDQGGPATREPGELVTERLPRARRHDDERVAPRRDALADLTLVRAEARVLEAPGEDLVDGARPHGDGGVDARRRAHTRRALGGGRTLHGLFIGLARWCFV